MTCHSSSLTCHRRESDLANPPGRGADHMMFRLTICNESTIYKSIPYCLVQTYHTFIVVLM